MYYVIVFLVFLSGLILGAFFPQQVKEGLRLLAVGIILAIAWIVGVIRRIWWWLAEKWRQLKETWGPRLPSLRKKLIAIAVVLLYLILSALGIMLLLAMGASWALLALAVALAFVILYALLFWELWGQIAAFGAWVALMAVLLWEAVTQFFNGFGNMLAELAGWIGSLLGDVLKWIAAGLTALSLSFCGPKQEAPVPAPVVTPVPQRFAVGVPLTAQMKVVGTITVKPKEGCLGVTQRGGMKLTLRECRLLAEEYDRKVERKGRFTLAPNIRLGETWYLVEENDSRKWIIPAPKKR